MRARAYLDGMSPTTSRDPVLAALRRRGAAIRRIRYRENRSVLLSVSRDGYTLNSHTCFRNAPSGVLDAIALFLRSRRGSTGHARALATIRGWEGTRRGLERARGKRRPRRRRAARTTPENERLRDLFDRFNRDRFDGRLPRIPLRVSHRMTRSLGTITYGRGEERRVTEIAISADLLAPVNGVVLEDTMLHEMAHAEAWLRHGHRGHGAAWRAIARRVGCTPRALIRATVRGRR
jgi:hypothetical protein